MGRKKIKITKKCPICGTNFETYPARPKKTCSKKCMGINQRGKNNPMYGYKWTAEQREKLSNYQKSIGHIISKRVKNDWAGNEKRRKAASITMQNTMTGRIGKLNPHYGKTLSEERKETIRKKSQEKFTPEYLKHFRKTMEIRGHWIPLNQKNDYEIYFKEAAWQKRMFDMVENGLKLLNEHGIFSAGTNNTGVIRDHIMGRKYGFKHKIFPEIIRHPCNCQIILHRENVSKGQRGKGRPDTDITIEELFQKIESYPGDWFEQKRVLQLIEDYRNGKRWTRK